MKEEKTAGATSPSEDMSYSWGTFLLVLAVIVGAIIWFTGGEDQDMQTSYEDLQGVQGVITSIDGGNQTFVLERKRVVEQEDGEFSLDHETFTIHWNDETRFLDYPSAGDLERGTPIETSIRVPRLNKNVVVKPREKAGNVITAVDIHFIPGSAQAEIVE